MQWPQITQQQSTQISLCVETKRHVTLDEGRHYDPAYIALISNGDQIIRMDMTSGVPSIANIDRADDKTVRYRQRPI